MLPTNAWKKVCLLGGLAVVGSAACTYAPPSANENPNETGGSGGTNPMSSSSSSGKGGAGNGSVSSSSSGESSSSSSSSSGNGGAGGSSSSSSSSSSSGISGNNGSTDCGGGACPSTVKQGCCLKNGTTPMCTSTSLCGLDPIFYCDGREDCGGITCCYVGKDAVCNEICDLGTFICKDDTDCPMGKTCVPKQVGPFGGCSQ